MKLRIQHKQILIDEDIVRAVTKDDVEEEEDDVLLPSSKISASKATKTLDMPIKRAGYNFKNYEEIILHRRTSGYTR